MKKHLKQLAGFEYRIFFIVIFFLIAAAFIFPADTFAAVTLPHTQHWDTISPWTKYYSGASLDSTESAPGDSPTSLKFTFPKGYPNGSAPDIVSVTFSADIPEFWFEYWFKYSSNWDTHPVGDKQSYWLLAGGEGSPGQGEFMIIRRHDSGDKLCWCWQSNIDQRAFNLVGNTSNSSAIKVGVWYKLTGHVVINTPGAYDGIVQMWINDQLTHDYNNVKMRVAGSTALWHSAKFTPVWGGNVPGLIKSVEDYFWVDNTTISASPIGSGTPSPTTCSSFTYSDWSSCQSNNTQTRTVTSSSPSGCTGGNPVTTQSCVYTPPQYCGDNSCNNGETTSSCPQDCPAPAPTYSLSDFTNLVADWLKTLSGSPADLNTDGKVNSKDLGIMMSNWKL